jgi:histidine triad (HIT) family protein
MAYDNQNIFAKILRGEAQAYTVYENDDCLAFLDVMPQTDGHTLVLPKAPAENIFDLDGQLIANLMHSVRHVACGVQNAFNPDGIKLMQFNGEAAGQTVFHLHMHIVPCYLDQPSREHGRDMAPATVLESHAGRIRAALNQL